jgi:pimeloyl-ACP methyl ester carboxylesterase
MSAVPDGCRSHVVDIGGDHRVHCVEAGEGPLVLMVHGFPESWYSWRHQIPAIAAPAIRAVAIDVRGYGRSSKPTRRRGLPHGAPRGRQRRRSSALGDDTATIIGHDWGAPIAWNSAMLRPDVFTAVAGLSVPFSPPGDDAPQHGDAGDGRRRGVLRRVLPGARPRRGRDRGRRARLAARLHVLRLGRRTAARPGEGHDRHRARGA